MLRLLVSAIRDARVPLACTYRYVRIFHVCFALHFELRNFGTFMSRPNRKPNSVTGLEPNRAPLCSYQKMPNYAQSYASKIMDISSKSPSSPPPPTYLGPHGKPQKRYRPRAGFSRQQNGRQKPARFRCSVPCHAPWVVLIQHSVSLLSRGLRRYKRGTGVYHAACKNMSIDPYN